MLALTKLLTIFNWHVVWCACSDVFIVLYERSRYSSAGHGPRTNLAPQNMQWAIRSREVSRSHLRQLSGNSNLVFVDSNSLRRSASTSTPVTATTEPVTMATTASCLARAFGLVIRQISDLLPLMLSGNQTNQDDISNIQVS